MAESPPLSRSFGTLSSARVRLIAPLTFLLIVIAAPASAHGEELVGVFLMFGGALVIGLIAGCVLVIRSSLRGVLLLLAILAVIVSPALWFLLFSSQATEALQWGMPVAPPLVATLMRVFVGRRLTDRGRA